jgi:hypothetical protein
MCGRGWLGAGMRIERIRFGSGFGRARAFEADFAIAFEDWSHEDYRTELYDVFAMYEATKSWSSVLRSSCGRSSKDMPKEHAWTKDCDGNNNVLMPTNW